MLLKSGGRFHHRLTVVGIARCGSRKTAVRLKMSEPLLTTPPVPKLPVKPALPSCRTQLVLIVVCPVLVLALVTVAATMALVH